jgi:pimeloyl-ACP methyl ester carboxylesterase
MNSRTAASRLPGVSNPAWFHEQAWPFETVTVETDDDVIAVSETGRGPVLLFVHVGTWSFVWRDLMRLLAHDFRCISLDAPGNGRTRSKNAAPVTLRRASSAIREVIEALDLENITLVLHDLGGPSGILAVDDQSSRVRGIVAMNTFAWKPDHRWLRKMLAIMGSSVMREFDVATGLVPRITATAFGVGRQLDQSDRDVFRAGMNARGIESFHQYMRDALYCEDVYPSVARTLSGSLAKSPLLTIFGQRNDPFGFQACWADAFPHAQGLVVLTGNHFPMCDAPELCAQAIRQWHAALDV